MKALENGASGAALQGTLADNRLVVQGSDDARRALVVEDDTFTVTLVAGFIESLGYEVVTASSGSEAMALLEGFDPDIAVVDLDLGAGPTGIDLVRVIRARSPWTAAVIMSSHRSIAMVADDPSLPDSHCEFVSKRDLHSTADLAEAIGRALAGTPAVTAPLGLPQLTPAQASLLRMIAAGLSNEEICRQRQTTPKSVERMISRLYKCLGLPTSASANARVEATRIFIDAQATVR